MSAPPNRDGGLLSLDAVLRERRRVAAVAAVFLVLGAGPPLLSHLQPDPAWLLHVTGRMLDGARLYVDVVEVNPPLILWLNLPAVLAARALGVPVGPVYVVWVLGIVGASLLACISLLRRLVPDHVGVRRGLGLLLVFALLPLAREDFGQREHLFLALAFPYMLVRALRAQGHEVPRHEALVVGLAAGLGIALKPYFVLLWVAMELFGRRSDIRMMRLESVTVLGVGVAYLAVVWWWTPEYFEVVRSMGGPYTQFLRNPVLTTALLGDGAQLPVVVALAGVAFAGRGGRDRAWTSLAWAMGALWIAAVLQQKGWRYHFYPALALAIVLSGWLAGNPGLQVRSRTERLYAAVCAAATILMLVWVPVAAIRQMLDPLNPRYDSDPDLTSLLPVARGAAGGRALVLSWSIASAYPLLPLAGVENVSRFPSLWILGATYSDDLRRGLPLRYHAPADMTPLERYLNDALAADLARQPPNLIIALRPGPDRREWGLRRLDLLDYVRRDVRIAKLLDGFSFARQVGEYWVLLPTRPGVARVLPPPRPSATTARPDPGLSGDFGPLPSTDIWLAGLMLVLVYWSYRRVDRWRLGGGSR